MLTDPVSSSPPSIDTQAARRWLARVPQSSAWLHEEVAARMAQRLRWMAQGPDHWLSWQPLLGGLRGHQAVAAQYPQAQAHVLELHDAARRCSRRALQRPWWQIWRRPGPRFDAVAPASMGLVWSNMILHMSPEPKALLQTWQRVLAEQGFLMFSCLGPDTARELRAVYTELGWPPGGHDFTDMHDWGDMLVEAGFAEPVMDMERLTLTYSSAAALLAEWREWGRNLHPDRFPALRGRRWRQSLEQALERRLRSPAHDGRLALTVELIFGHAYKPAARMAFSPELVIPLEQMRQRLRRGAGVT